MYFLFVIQFHSKADQHKPIQQIMGQITNYEKKNYKMLLNQPNYNFSYVVQLVVEFDFYFQAIEYNKCQLWHHVSVGYINSLCFLSKGSQGIFQRSLVHIFLWKVCLLAHIISVFLSSILRSWPVSRSCFEKFEEVCLYNSLFDFVTQVDLKRRYKGFIIMYDFCIAALIYLS